MMQICNYKLLIKLIIFLFSEYITRMKLNFRFCQLNLIGTNICIVLVESFVTVYFQSGFRRDNLVLFIRPA